MGEQSAAVSCSSEVNGLSEQSGKSLVETRQLLGVDLPEGLDGFRRLVPVGLERELKLLEEGLSRHGRVLSQGLTERQVNFESDRSELAFQ